VTPRDERSDHTLAGSAFLNRALLGAFNTVNGHRPLSREGRTGVVTFFPSWLTSELPLHALAWQVLATGLHIRRGALRSRAGRIGLVVDAASWYGLYRLWAQGMASEAVYDHALADGLGDEVAAVTVPPGLLPAVRRRKLLLGPTDYPRRRWVHDPTRSYGEFGRRNQLDVWRSPDLRPGDQAPVLLQVHGGAWIIGNKDQQGMPLMERLAGHGWVCVSINYRLSPRAKWPAHIVDVKRALGWIKTHIAEYGGDPDFVAITGGSAGGHLCALAALTANEKEFQPGFEEVDTSVACAVPFYGVYDFTNRDDTGRADMDDLLTRMVMGVSRTDDPGVWDHASPMSWVDHDAPPFLVLHGTNDCLVPVEQARSFVAMLREASPEPVVYAELPGAQHAFDVFASPRSLYAVDAVERFLAVVHERHRASTSGTTR
jgi:acetyl esterase/lipase